jgi:selenium metabolism protein YedF
MTKKAIEEIDEGVITVLVDSVASRENVIKFVKSEGLTCNVSEKDNWYEIEIVKGYSCEIEKDEKSKSETTKNIVLYIGSSAIGNGDCVLGEKLMNAFIQNIKNMDTLPKSIICVNTGVYLTTLNADTIAELKNLENVEILSCGTCLEYFELTDKLQVGEITDAYTVMKKLFEADKVIRL